MTAPIAGDALARVLEALGAEDAEVRRGAVLAARELPGVEVTPVLVAALGDADWRVRKEAARIAIVHVEARAALLPALVEALERPGAVGLHNSAVEVLVGIGTPAVPVLLARLSTLDPPARRFALEALGDIGDAAAIPALLGASREPEPNLRAAAIEALGRVGGTEVAQALSAIVEDEEDPFLRLAALESSQRAGAVLPTPLLATLVEDRILRRAALHALGRTGAAAAVSPIARALRDHARATAAAAVASLGDLVENAGLAEEVRAELVGLGPAELGLLGDLVRAGSLPERQAAVRLLGLTDRDEAVELLAAAAADDDLAMLVDASLRRTGPSAARALLAALAEAPPRALPVLLPILADLARATAAEADVAIRLGELLSADDEGVAACAAECLGTLAAAPWVPALAGMLRGRSPRVARAASQALTAIGGRQPASVRAALEPPVLEGPSAPLVAALLGTVGSPEDVALLRAALGASEVPLRRAAVDALARLGGEAAAEAVILALADESEDVQAAAAAALGRRGGRRAAESLAAALSASSPRVVAAAARALGELGEAAAAEPLRLLVASPHGVVAVAALDALGRLGDGGVPGGVGDGALEGALAHPDAEVVKHALRLAAQGEPSRAVERLARALGHEAWDVRQRAVRLLAERSEPAARDALARRAPQETDDLVRAALAEALGSSSATG